MIYNLILFRDVTLTSRAGELSARASWGDIDMGARETPITNRYYVVQSSGI